MTSLGPSGYSVDKSTLTAAIIAEVKRDLTVRPNVNPQLNTVPTAFPVYIETDTRLFVPRYYGLERFGMPKTVSWNVVKENETSKLVAAIDLRGPQVEIANKTIDQLTRGSGSGILHLYTGAGKTVLALHVIGQLKVKTMIVVHKSILLNQWIERIKEFLPEARVGVIQGKRIEIEGVDIVIAMLKSLSMKEYAENAFDDIGLLVVDECHHIGAEVFSRALRRVAPRYNLGLSATPERKDGLSRVFKWYLGNVIHKATRESPCTIVKKIFYHSENSDSKYLSEPKNYMGKPMLPLMLNNIGTHELRNRLILHEIAEYLAADKRMIMVMSERLAQLKWLYQEFKAAPPATIDATGKLRPATGGLYIGSMKQADLDASAKCDVLFASAAICREGLDIPELNTMILATPAGDVVQACGRIMRKAHVTTCPLIIDIVDCFSVFCTQAKTRTRFYEKSKFTVFDVHWTEGQSMMDVDATVDDMKIPVNHNNHNNHTIELKPSMALFKDDD